MKIVNLLYIASLAILSVFLKSCLKTEASMYPLDLYNQTEDDLYTLCRWDTYYTNQYNREDALGVDSTLYHKEKVESGYYHAFFENGRDPRDFLKPTDTLTIFILDKEEYEGKTWSQLVDSAHFRQIYHLSGDDIRLIGRKVPYPPSEIMRDMDMVPSYEEAVK